MLKANSTVGVFTATAALLLGFATSNGLPSIRVMPMGDSITLGVGGGGYREDLGNLLGSNASTGGRWSFAGLLYGGGGVHCGYNGQTIEFLATTIAAEAFERQPPTHLLIMVGRRQYCF